MSPSPLPPPPSPQPVDGLAETESGELVPIKLLDCDTITQAKEKILDVLYKNTAASCRPQLTDVDLGEGESVRENQKIRKCLKGENLAVITLIN